MSDVKQIKKLTPKHIIFIPETAFKSNQQYDFESLDIAGLGPDETGHFPSRVPAGVNEGLILKSEDHPTFYKTIAADQKLGFKFYRHIGSGRLFSFPKDMNISKKIFRPLGE